MSTSQTPNYGLHQWAGGDQFKRTEFNEDNARVDAALHGLRSDLTAQSAVVNGKAAQTALDALSATVSKKADQTALDALSARVNTKADQSALNALSATVGGKGNCKIVTGSYTGTGKNGVNYPNSLTFDSKPMLVVIAGHVDFLILMRGQQYGVGSLSPCPILTWGNNSVSWYNNKESSYQANAPDLVYYYVALLAVS